jgi:hypothetical protein
MVEMKKKNTANLMILNNLRMIDFLTAMPGKIVSESDANLRKFLFVRGFVIPEVLISVIGLPQVIRSLMCKPPTLI